MQQTWLKREGNCDLALFILGWAATPNAICHLDLPGCDVLACHDHRSMKPLAAHEFAGYRRIYLFAWSFGVWVAEHCCRELPLYRAIALNGTPFPADERYGMRLRAALRSMRALAKTGSTPPAPAGPWADLSPEEKFDELSLLAERSRADSAAHLHWDAAFIADKDEIFPPANMQAYWGSVGLGTMFPGTHNPFADPALIRGAIEA